MPAGQTVSLIAASGALSQAVRRLLAKLDSGPLHVNPHDERTWGLDVNPELERLRTASYALDQLLTPSRKERPDAGS